VTVLRSCCHASLLIQAIPLVASRERRTLKREHARAVRPDLPEVLSLRGKTAVVTGGGSGIGRVRYAVRVPSTKGAADAPLNTVAHLACRYPAQTASLLVPIGACLCSAWSERSQRWIFLGCCRHCYSHRTSCYGQEISLLYASRGATTFVLDMSQAALEATVLRLPRLPYLRGHLLNPKPLPISQSSIK
jgi:hypothetical protein